MCDAAAAEQPGLTLVNGTLTSPDSLLALLDSPSAQVLPLPEAYCHLTCIYFVRKKAGTRRQVITIAFLLFNLQVLLNWPAPSQTAMLTSAAAAARLGRHTLLNASSIDGNVSKAATSGLHAMSELHSPMHPANCNVPCMETYCASPADHNSAIICKRLSGHHTCCRRLQLQHRTAPA
jgi:hypothetical protein